jgi:hypothetical protein
MEKVLRETIVFLEVQHAILGQLQKVMRIILQRRQSMEWSQAFGTIAGRSLGLVQSSQPIVLGQLEGWKTTNSVGFYSQR